MSIYQILYTIHGGQWVSLQNCKTLLVFRVATRYGLEWNGNGRQGRWKRLGDGVPSVFFPII